MKINGKEIKAEMFAYDGCHKIYLLKNEDEESEAFHCGYDILSIENLRSIWEKSCYLRFISTWDLTECVVEQGEENVEFE